MDLLQGLDLSVVAADLGDHDEVCSDKELVDARVKFCGKRAIDIPPGKRSLVWQVLEELGIWVGEVQDANTVGSTN